MTKKELYNSIAQSIKSLTGADVTVSSNSRNHKTSIRLNKGYNVLEPFLSYYDAEEIDSSPYSGGKNFKAFKLIFNNNEIVVSFDASDIHRKDTTPDALGLAGITYTSKKQLEDDIKKSGHEDTAKLIHLLTTNDISVFEKKAHQHILNDFGEVMGAYNDIDESTKIYFPPASNHPLIDYMKISKDGSIGVSSKNGVGSGNALSNIKELIEEDDTILENRILLHQCSRHKKCDIWYSFFLCKPLVKNIKFLMDFFDIEENLFIKTTKRNKLVENKINEKLASVSYGDLIDWLEENNCSYPERFNKNAEKAYYKNQSNSILFTLLTELRKSGVMDDAITNIMNKKDIEIKVSYKSKNTIWFETKKASKTNFTYHYHGNGGSPLNNYPGYRNL